MNKKLNIIAGPCSVDTKEKLFNTIDELYKYGIRTIRAGIWKPRTKPGSFQGIGEDGLKWLKQIKQQKYKDIKIAIQVATPEHIELALKYNVDILWIGARTTTSPFAMSEISNTLFNLSKEQKENLMIYIKNPVCPDLNLWQGAYLRIKNSGVKNIGFIHRGFSTYDKIKYRNDPIWKIPLAMKLKYPDIEMINDPSHISGNKFYIEEIMKQAKVFNFDGYIIQSHICPEEALSDSQQQITPSKLNQFIKEINLYTSKDINKDQLKNFRKSIDEIDSKLLSLLQKRMEISKEIGKYKKEHGIQIYQPERLKALIENLILKSYILSPEFIENIWMEIHNESIKNQ